MNERPCTVALLRPPETGWEAFGKQLERDCSLVPDVQEPVYNSFLDVWLDELHERYAAIADELAIPASIEEYELHSDLDLPGTKRRRLIDEADIVTAVDPSDRLSAYLHATTRCRPLRRIVVACTTADVRDSLLSILATSRSTVIEKKLSATKEGSIFVVEESIHQRNIPNMFAFLYRDEETMDYVLAEALRYPDCTPL